MFHADNAYCLNAARITGHRCKTHTVSNTAFRGFGGPQGMMTAECMMDDIARYLGKDPLSVRKQKSLWRVSPGYLRFKRPTQLSRPHPLWPKDRTLPLLGMIEQLESQSGYHARRAAIQAFNKEHPS